MTLNRYLRATGQDAGTSRSDGGIAVTVEDTQRLVAVSGLPGVGKSTVAEYVAEYVGADRLRTDVVRKELFEEPKYTEEETRTVYEELCERAERKLERGDSVVLDATFADSRHREAVRDLVRNRDVTFQFVEVVCDPDVAERRIVRRDDISDADVEVYREFREEFDPIEIDHVTIDNSGSKDKTRTQIEGLF